jgi:hypothetical protein
MRHTLMALAGFVFAGLLTGPAAFAQQVPQGSYLQSCRDIRMDGGTLTGLCRQANGRWDKSALGEVGACVGDIGNIDGALTCSRGPGFGAGRVEERREGLGVERRDDGPRLRCEGIIDPIARGRCLHGF